MHWENLLWHYYAYTNECLVQKKKKVHILKLFFWQNVDYVCIRKPTNSGALTELTDKFWAE